MPQLVLFDYQSLDTEARIVVQQRTNEIKTLMRKTAQDIIEIGQKLIEVKGRLPHGSFGDWLESEFEWKERAAQNFMRVAERFKTANFADMNIAPSALYLLAAPSTPEPVRQEVIQRAQSGERITHKTAKTIINEHKEQPSNPDSEPPPTPPEPKPYAPQHSTAATFEQSAPEPPREFNYKRDSRFSPKKDVYTPQGMDACQTPDYAVEPLLPYLEQFETIWEPAQGEGLILDYLTEQDFRVIGSDLITDQNFFEYEPDKQWDAIITNPPYSIKFQWLKRCYDLGKPFALLLPVETLGTKTAQALFKEHGMELILLDRRVAFKMPNKGWDSSPQFPTAWFTSEFNIGEKITYATLSSA